MEWPRRNRGFVATVWLLTVVLGWEGAWAGTLRDRIAERRLARESEVDIDTDVGSDGPVTLPADIRMVRNVPYGSDPLQRFDVYAPGKSRTPLSS